MKLSKRARDISVSLVGDLIERKDKERSWLPNKDKELEDIKRGIMTRRTALSGYTELRKDY